MKKEKMTPEQYKISRSNQSKARRHFIKTGEWYKGCIMHHKDIDMINNDIERYILWNISDLQIVSKKEHQDIHLTLPRGPLPTKVKNKISKKMKGNRNSVGNKGTSDYTWHIENGKRIYTKIETMI